MEKHRRMILYKLSSKEILMHYDECDDIGKTLKYQISGSDLAEGFSMITIGDGAVFAGRLAIIAMQKRKDNHESI